MYTQITEQREKKRQINILSSSSSSSYYYYYYYYYYIPDLHHPAHHEIANFLNIVSLH